MLLAMKLGHHRNLYHHHTGEWNVRANVSKCNEAPLIQYTYGYEGARGDAHENHREYGREADHECEREYVRGDERGGAFGCGYGPCRLAALLSANVNEGRM